MENEKYQQHQFYNTNDLSLSEKRVILREAKEKCFKWWVDDLPGMARRKIEMSFKDILKKLDSSCHFVIIHRKGYSDPWFLEIGFTTMKEKTYYLWICCDEEHIPFFIKKYKLKPK